MARFEDLSDDVLYLILRHLSPERLSSLCCLRLVSTRVKAFAESVLYRNIILEDNDQHDLASYRFIERLSNPGDALSQHVRSLQIKSFRGDHESFCMNTELLAACLNSLERLSSFNWDSKVPLPGGLLSILHERLPDVRLCATVNDLDQALLDSPQLHRLAVSLPDLDPTDHKKPVLWEQLKQILVHCHNLRRLMLDVHPDRTVRPLPDLTIEGTQNSVVVESYTRWGYRGVSTDADITSHRSRESEKNMVQIPLEPGDVLPTLEDLDIRAKTYNLDARHCAQLLHCMNWTRLRRLRLGPSDPKMFFETFKDKLPNLEVFEFTYIYENLHYTPYDTYTPKLSACAEFVASITVLKEFIVRCNTVNLKDSLWMSLAEVHGPHLERLSIQARYQDLEAPICNGNLGDLLACFSNLLALDLALRTCISMPFMCSFCPIQGHALSTNYVDTIPVIASIRSLQISIRVHPCDQSLYSYIADHAHCAIRKVWTAYANDSRNCELETFNIKFWRWEPTSPHLNEDGFPRNAHITRLVFESRMCGDRLIIKPRNHHKVQPVNQVWHGTEGEGLQATYVAEEQNVPAPLFNVSDRFREALGRFFPQLPNGTRSRRYR
ncbi:uncharacterized protein K460DRAFT_134131 [Cucurbitaria berberidis CBS 394.84]|uniref:F-box domain-containing protein n=1 Tax=Cucurbitaria berberidis CBS 394.84 TaxID=1168544 RepID=A0A9P4GCN1_9PLEO|nr:uncharacterized protein K460DRAFT_134131 [Cucurbitaria berberidis CBS 394.84]KAF1842755.1 hypothetical protein K460DRAFT_134131 [Cucurbitaria berberidis CBS 394.84]